MLHVTLLLPAPAPSPICGKDRGKSVLSKAHGTDSVGFETINDQSNQVGKYGPSLFPIAGGPKVSPVLHSHFLLPPTPVLPPHPIRQHVNNSMK